MKKIISVFVEGVEYVPKIPEPEVKSLTLEKELDDVITCWGTPYKDKGELIEVILQRVNSHISSLIYPKRR